MIPFFYFNIALVGMAALWCFTHLPGHGFHVLTSSNFLTSVVLLATTVGLMRRHPMALNSLLGLAGLLCCIPISFLVSGFTASAASAAGGGFMRHFLPKAVPAIVSGFADDLVFNLVISTIALITFRMIRSVKFSNYFEVEKASWPRAFASMGALLVLFMLNYTTAEKSAAASSGGALDSLSTLQTMMSSPELQEAIATGDMTAVAQKLMEKQANGTPEERKALTDLQNKLGIKGVPAAIAETALEEAKEKNTTASMFRPEACQFALDESHLAIELSNQDLSIIDLRTRQLSHRKVPAGQKVMGPDLDLYFDIAAHSVKRFADPTFSFVLPASQRFLSFTATPQQILIYDTPATGIRRIEVPSGRVIWNVVAQLEPGAVAAAFTSLDLNWAYLRLGSGKPFLFNIATGRSIDPNLSFTHIRSVEFGATPIGSANWVRFSGQSDDGRIRMALVDLRSGQTDELPIPDASIALFDRDRNVYITAQPPIQLKKYTVASDGGINVSNQDLGISSQILFTSLLSGGRFVAMGVQGEKQMLVIDFNQNATLKVGSVHESAFEPGQVCFAASASRQLFAVASGASVQIFWTSELSSPAPRSLTVPLSQ